MCSRRAPPPCNFFFFFFFYALQGLASTRRWRAPRRSLPAHLRASWRRAPWPSSTRSAPLQKHLPRPRHRRCHPRHQSTEIRTLRRLTSRPARATQRSLSAREKCACQLGVFFFLFFFAFFFAFFFCFFLLCALFCALRAGGRPCRCFSLRYPLL